MTTETTPVRPDPARTKGRKAGFVGLGNMGWPMAHNLAEAGFELVVHDAAPELSRRFAAEHPNATAATGPASFHGVPVVVTMLPNGVIVREVVLTWDGGIASALGPGAIVLDMSSSNPSDTLELGTALEAGGVHVVDAPVSGGVPRAVTGELSIMVGGRDEDVAAVQPELQVMGDAARQFRAGGPGSGHVLKALNNFVAAATYCATAEALVVGKTFGLDTGVIVDTINTSTGRSFVSELVFGGHAVTGKYATGFQLGLLAKDVHIAADIAASLGIDAPVTALTDERWAQALSAVGPAADHSAAHKAWSEVDLTRD
ncbi:NAD(P)-dependent oxidoreductase [Dactylosporangium sp. CA-092794]|uniref:NAD(P)-dependent oxidoreductase n=1 Tax=Dactylosporangium sp. CA-092794 TaxID=3239929 RepID=UPI003D8F304C